MYSRRNVDAPIRVAIAGLGFGAEVHAPALKAMRGINLVALAGRSLEKATRVAARLEVPHAVGDFHALAEYDLDAVLIALPPEENAAAAEYFMRLGVSVLCEKPVAADIATARRLAELGEGRTHAVDFQFAELPAFLCARQSLMKGAIGVLSRIELTWLVESYAVRHKLHNWKREAGAARGGVLPLLASHAMYLVEWLHSPLTDIVAKLAEEGGPWRLEGRIAPDSVDLDATLQGGATLHATISNAAAGAHVHRWRFIGTSGELVIENPCQDYMSGFSASLVSEGHVRTLLPAESQSEADGRLPPFRSLAERFFESMRTSTTTYPDFWSGWRVQCAIDACIRSHLEARPVRLAEYAA